MKPKHSEMASIAKILLLGCVVCASPVVTAQTMTRVPVFQTDTTGGNEAHMWVAEIEPGAETGLHLHPTPRFVYVLEGAVVLEIDGQPDRMFAAGEGFQERAGVLHNFRNASATLPTRAMGFQIAAPGQALQAQEELEAGVFTRNVAPLTFDHMGPGGPNYFFRSVPLPPRGAAFTGPTFDVFVGAGRWRDMELVELTPMLGHYFGADTGILVVRAPSDATELQDGDVILEIGARTPNSREHAMRILGSFEPGETLELTIMRDQRQQTLEIELHPGG